MWKKKSSIFQLLKSKQNGVHENRWYCDTAFQWDWVFKFEKWTLRFFEFKNCKDPVTKDKGEADNIDVWKGVDVKATNYIYSAILNKQLEYITTWFSI